MCEEVKRIKENYNYDFSSLLISSNDSSQNINEKNAKIEAIADELRKGIISTNTIGPVPQSVYAQPIIGMSTHFGFLNVKGNFNNLQGENAQYRNASGMIAIDGSLIENYGTDKLIILNPKEKAGHRRFTIAHELGHYLFDFNEQQDIVYYDFYRKEEAYINDQEQRASRFAAALLMPKEIFENRYNELKTMNKTLYEIVNQLAKDFIVSTSAVRRRIEEIKELNSYQAD